MHKHSDEATAYQEEEAVGVVFCETIIRSAFIGI